MRIFGITSAHTAIKEHEAQQVFEAHINVAPPKQRTHVEHGVVYTQRILDKMYARHKELCKIIDDSVIERDQVDVVIRAMEAAHAHLRGATQSDEALDAAATELFQEEVK